MRGSRLPGDEGGGGGWRKEGRGGWWLDGGGRECWRPRAVRVGVDDFIQSSLGDNWPSES